MPPPNSYAFFKYICTIPAMCVRCVCALSMCWHFMPCLLFLFSISNMTNTKHLRLSISKPYMCTYNRKRVHNTQQQQQQYQQNACILARSCVRVLFWWRAYSVFVYILRSIRRNVIAVGVYIYLFRFFFFVCAFVISVFVLRQLFAFSLPKLASLAKNCMWCSMRGKSVLYRLIYW